VRIPTPLFLLLTMTLLLIACGDDSLESYTPKDQNESEIKTLLSKYKSAIDNDDEQNFLSCFHKDSKFMNPTGDMIAKDELSQKLPVWLSKWDKVDISKIKIELKEDTAKVEVKEKIHFHGHETLGLNKLGLTFFELVRENDNWFIVELSKI